MAARKLILVATLAMMGLWCAYAQTGQSADSPKSPAQSTDPAQSEAGSSSSKPHSSNTSANREHHRIQVEDEASQPHELTAAEDLIQKKDYAAAEPLLRKFLDSNPSNYEAWYDLGFTDNGLGKIDESIAAYRKSVEAKPDLFESNLNLGRQLAKAHQPDAEQYLRAATRLKPADPDTEHVVELRAGAWFSLAQAIQQSNPDEALDAYRKAAELQPKSVEPHLEIGRIFEEQNKFADAEQEYRQVLALKPDKEASADALAGLANIHMRGRVLVEAEADLRKLVVLRPDSANAHLQLGRVLEAENKNDDAIAELETAAKLAPSDPAVRRELADLYLAAGKDAQAEPAYRALLTAHPNDAELHRALGQTFLREKKFPEALQELLATVKLKPDWADAYFDLAFAASENKDYPLTLKALDIRAKSQPENARTYFLRGSALDHLHDFKQAAANYHLFLKTAGGKYPDYEWQAKHRLIAIEPKK